MSGPVGDASDIAGPAVGLLHLVPPGASVAIVTLGSIGVVAADVLGVTGATDGLAMVGAAGLSGVGAYLARGVVAFLAKGMELAERGLDLAEALAKGHGSDGCRVPTLNVRMHHTGLNGEPPEDQP